MKTVDLSNSPVTVAALLKMARGESVLVRDKRGGKFLLSPADSFEAEVELLRRNHDFLSFLDRRFKSRKTVTLEELEAREGRPGRQKR